jgi:hypothetical protein
MFRAIGLSESYRIREKYSESHYREVVESIYDRITFGGKSLQP